eukprot:scaffold11260_cov88-Skeletonema_marinoi.AAC.1
MANYDGSLAAFHFNTQSLRYDMVLESSAGGLRPSQLGLNQVTYEVVASSIRQKRASISMLVYYHCQL